MKFTKFGFGLGVLILKVLDRETRQNGAIAAYDILTRIHELTEYLWRPSPGSLYPILENFQKEGYISVKKDEGKDTFAITNEGVSRLNLMLSMGLIMETMATAILYTDFDIESFEFPIEAIRQRLKKTIDKMPQDIPEFFTEQNFFAKRFAESINTKITILTSLSQQINHLAPLQE